MRSKADTNSEEAEKAMRDIRRATRRLYSAEEKVHFVIAGLGGEDSVAELCRKEGINQNLYYRWSKASRAPRRCPTTNLSCCLARKKPQTLCIQMIVDPAEPSRRLERRQPDARITIFFHPCIATLAHGRIPD